LRSADFMQIFTTASSLAPLKVKQCERLRIYEITISGEGVLGKTVKFVLRNGKAFV